MEGGGRGGWEQVQAPGDCIQRRLKLGTDFPFPVCCCSFLPLTFVSSAAAKLSCSYSGFSSPRVEWKFAQGDITSLVCYNNKITGEFPPLPS